MSEPTPIPLRASRPATEPKPTHAHLPRIVRWKDAHAAHTKDGGFSARLAILITNAVSTMACASVFAFLALLGLPNLLPPIVAQWVQWTSQTFIQLTMLSILMVGQSLLGKHQELQSIEQFHTTQKTYEDSEQIKAMLADILKTMQARKR